LAEKQAVKAKPTFQEAKFISIELGRTCLHYVQNNITYTCPTYKDLKSFDNSNEKVSGKFITEKGFYHRDTPQIKNHQLMYKANQTIVCVDCSFNVLNSGQRIIIEPPHLKYIKRGDIFSNFTMTMYEGRYVDNCQTATIGWGDIPIEDTINYLKSGCTKTDFNEKKTIYLGKTVHDITTTQAFKNKQYMDVAKKQAQKLAEEYCLKKGSKCR
jgi:hypothetical protein